MKITEKVLRRVNLYCRQLVEEAILIRRNIEDVVKKLRTEVEENTKFCSAIFEALEHIEKAITRARGICGSEDRMMDFKKKPKCFVQDVASDAVSNGNIKYDMVKV